MWEELPATIYKYKGRKTTETVEILCSVPNIRLTLL